MSLIDLIKPDVIRVPLAAGDKPGVIRELCELLKDAGKITDVEETYSAIMAREDKGSTGLENGIAVPHAKCSTVDRLTLAIGISSGGIDFYAQDGKPSHLFFFLLAAPGQAGPHIEALAEIARLTRHASFVDMIIHATTPQQVAELFGDG